MPSIGTSVRQNDRDAGYYINVGDLTNKIFTSPQLSTPSVAVWASTFGTATAAAITNGCYASSIKTAGTAILKDMGKTVVSSGIFFRKVQLVVPQGASGTQAGTAGTTSTFGVAGGANGAGTPDFLSGYIVLGFDGQNTPAPVAKFGL